MYNIDVFSINPTNYALSKLESINLKSLGISHPNYGVISEVIRWQRAKKRSAHPRARTKGEVKGTNRKPFAQKGKGMARQGSLKNPHQRGGGVAFPPKNRVHTYKINKKKKILALKSVLLIRMLENRILFIDAFQMESPSTKFILNMLEKLSFSKTLFIDEDNNNLKLSIRNLKISKFIKYSGINTFDILKFPHLVITKCAFEKVLVSIGVDLNA